MGSGFGLRRRAGAVMAWIVAATSIGFAGVSWVHAPQRPSPAARVQTTGGDSRIEGLRAAVAVAREEHRALREELERMLRRQRSSAPSAGASPAVHAAGDAGVDATHAPSETVTTNLSHVADRYGQALSLSVAGEPGAREEADEARAELLAAGPAAFAALREAYLSNPDPRVRKLILESMTSGEGVEAQEFVAGELRSETNPEVRSALAVRASQMATPAMATVFHDVFLEVLASERDDGLRIAAVQGLRHLVGDPAVDAALFDAASAPAKELRLAAIDVLASRPEVHGRVREIIEAEPDRTVRELGRCSLVFAEDDLR